MNLINRETKEIIDSKALAERVGWDYKRVLTYTKDGRKIDGEYWDRIPEDAMVSKEEPEEEPLQKPIKITESQTVVIDTIITDYGNIEVRKGPFNKTEFAFPMDMVETLGLKKIDAFIEKYKIAHPDKKPMRRISMKVYNLTAVRNWVAPIGGQDKVQVIETGEIITMRHSEKDPRYDMIREKHLIPHQGLYDISSIKVEED